MTKEAKIPESIDDDKPVLTSWSTSGSTDCTGTPSDGYRLVSYVDAQNAFGATGRTRFSCTVDRGLSGRYQIVEFLVLPESSWSRKTSSPGSIDGRLAGITILLTKALRKPK